MKTATYRQHILQFKTPGGTSRGVLNTKETYLLEIFENGKKGIGECGLFRGLSCDDVPEYESKLQWLCSNINEDAEALKEELRNFPSLWFGYEQAMLNLKHDNSLYFPSEFTEGKKGIRINGLIWMGDAEYMQEQIREKLQQGFGCLKLKIGSDWETEHQILKILRTQFPAQDLELRVDANGAFSPEQATTVLEELAKLKIHSIEQPIKAGNRTAMKQLCSRTPVPIALDEELIGINQVPEKQILLEEIRPQFIILKPSLSGGFSGSDEWISAAEKTKTGWWITSALESNIGLNAIAQYVYTKNNPMPQGLGTGNVFTNNFETPIVLEGDVLMYDSEKR